MLVIGHYRYHYYSPFRLLLLLLLLLITPNTPTATAAATTAMSYESTARRSNLLVPPNRGEGGARHCPQPFRKQKFLSTIWDISGWDLVFRVQAVGMSRMLDIQASCFGSGASASECLGRISKVSFVNRSVPRSFRRAAARPEQYQGKHQTRRAKH